MIFGNDVSEVIDGKVCVILGFGFEFDEWFCVDVDKYWVVEIGVGIKDCYVG